MLSAIVENELWFVSCTDNGTIIAENKSDTKDSFQINLFGSNYKELSKEWNVVCDIYLTADSKYLIATYGMGYVYIVSLLEKKLTKRFQLFPEINYDNETYKNIDMCCYYDEQEPKNLAVIAFSPEDKYFVTGALGNVIKVFQLNSGKCLGTFSSLVWIADSCGIRNCQLVVFLDCQSFVYVNHESNIVKVKLSENGLFAEAEVLRTEIPRNHGISEGVYSSWSYIDELKLVDHELWYHVEGNRKNYRGMRKIIL